MGDHVRVSYPRLTQYADLCGKQDGYLASVDGMVNGSCGNLGAFTGFMALFKSAYAEAHTTVADSMDDARRAARDAASAFEGVRTELKAADGLAQGDLDKVSVTLEAPGGYDGPGAPGSPGGVPGEVKYVNGLAGTVASTTDTMAGGVNAPDHSIRGLPTDGLNLLSDGTDFIGTGLEIGETEDDLDDYRDFEDEHGDREGAR